MMAFAIASGSFSGIRIPFIPSDKLTARDARDQLIAGGCFAIPLERLRSRSAYQGQWS
ncbi:MAG: hypothetical protein Q7J15_02525 [Candidatus Desulfaltia sp.]|nr:hypothetical protein [Candidatus Desulfaltia sp.]